MPCPVNLADSGTRMYENRLLSRSSLFSIVPAKTNKAVYRLPFKQTLPRLVLFIHG